MWKDIKENTEIDVENELMMGRVYSEDSFTADYFYHSFLAYTNTKIRDLL